MPHSPPSPHDLEAYQHDSQHRAAHEHDAYDRVPLMHESGSSSVTTTAATSSSSSSSSITLRRIHLQLLVGWALVATIMLIGLIFSSGSQSTAITTALSQSKPPSAVESISSLAHSDTDEGSTGSNAPPSSSQSKSKSKSKSISEQESSIAEAESGTSTIGASDTDTSSDGPTYDQRIFPLPSHLPWSSAPISIVPAAPTDTPSEVCLPLPLAAEWNGVLEYSSTPLIPEHHLRSDRPRFAQLTDIHLEPRYDPEEQSTDSSRPGVCRRRGGDGDGDESNDWERKKSTTSNSSRFPLGRNACDTPIALLESALSTLASLAGAPSNSSASTTVTTPLPLYSFLLLSGDLVAHFVSKPSLHTRTHDHALSEVVKVLAERIVSGKERIFPAIGNTDLFPTGYIVDTEERVTFRVKDRADKRKTMTVKDCHPTFANILHSYTKHGLLLSTEAQESFCRGGYYSATVPELNWRIVVLNSIPYSPNFINDPEIERAVREWHDQPSSNMTLLDSLLPLSSPLSCTSPSRSSDPYSQFSWLSSELSAASSAGQSVLLMSHIPPGHKDAPKEMAWCGQYTDRLRQVLSESKVKVEAGVFGDFSEDAVRFVYTEKDEGKDAKSDALNEQSSSSSKHDSKKSVASTPSSAAVDPLPLASLFVAPGLSPRKMLNPSVRVWYLSENESAVEEEETNETLSIESKKKSKHQSTSSKSDNKKSSSSWLTLSSSKKSSKHSKKHSSESVDAGAAASSSSPSPTYRLFDYSQWYLPLHYANTAAFSGASYSWQYHYSFRSSYRQDDMTAHSLAEFVRDMENDPTAMQQYLLHTSVNQPSNALARTYVDALCDMRYIDAEENEECKRTGKVL